MPTQTVPIFRVTDADRALAWWRRLGFTHDFTHRFDGTTPRFVGIRRDKAAVYLSEHAGDAYGPGLVYLWVEDVDALAAEFGCTVTQNPWGRDFEVADPDGNRVRVAAREPGQSA